MTPTLTHARNEVIDRRYIPEELRAVISQAEDLIGDTLDDLVVRHRLGASSRTPPRYPHRLVELLLRLRRAADDPGDRLAEGVAAVSIAEVGGILEIFAAWQTNPTWPEFQQAVQDPRSYLHAVATLSVAGALKEHHPRTELIASSTAGPSRDIPMVATEEDYLAVEVKTSQSIGQRDGAMSVSEARAFVEESIRDASNGFKHQLEKGRPWVLVIGGFHIDSATFDALGDAAAYVLSHGRARRHLLATVISHTRFAPPAVKRGRVFIGLEHETRITTKPRYEGALRFVGD